MSFFYDAIPASRLNIGITITPDRVAFTLLLAAFVYRVATSRRPREPLPAATFIGVMGIAFAVTALTSWFVTGSDVGNARFGHLVWICNLAVYPAFAFFIARRVVYDRTMLKLIVVFFAVFGIYLGATAVAEHYGVGALVFPRYILDANVGTHVGRSRGPFVNTIANGGMLVLGFISSSALICSMKGFRRLIALLPVMAIVVAIYFTETRSVWLSLAIVTTTMLGLRTPHRTTAAAVLACLLCAFALGIGSKFSAFDPTLFSRRQHTVDYRIDNYTFAWNAFTANPMFGLGYGKFYGQWRQYADLQNSRLREGLSDGNHNTLLGILADLGLAGGVPFLLIIAGSGLVCWVAYRRVSSARATFEQKFILLPIGMLLVYVMLGLTSDLKAVAVVNVTTFFLVGVASSIASGWSPSTRQRASASVSVSSSKRRWRPDRP